MTLIVAVWAPASLGMAQKPESTGSEGSSWAEGTAKLGWWNPVTGKHEQPAESTTWRSYRRVPCERINDYMKLLNSIKRENKDYVQPYSKDIDALIEYLTEDLKACTDNVPDKTSSFSCDKIKSFKNMVYKINAQAPYGHAAKSKAGSSYIEDLIYYLNHDVNVMGCGHRLN